MKKNRAIHHAIGVLALVAASGVCAQQAAKKPTGWYVGGSVGHAGFDTDYVRTKQTIFNTGANTFTIFSDAKETMWKGYFGYQLLPNFSIEAGYWDFGTPSYSTTITAPVTASMKRNFRADGYGYDVVYWLPVVYSFSGFAKVGAMQTTVQASAASPGGGLGSLPAETARKFNSTWGLGVKYDINQDWAARVEYETVRNVGDVAKFGNADVIMWSFGVNYKF